MADKEYGGWYDNPDTGTNMRWWDGVWTTGDEPGGSGGDTSTPSGGGGEVQSNYTPMEYNLPSVEEYITAISAMLPEPPPRYDEVNPFYFDEEWANEYATAEFSPYFDEILQDYMTDVETTRTRLGEDTGKFLTEMESQKDTFMEKSGIELERMLRGINLGYESKGLYFSGMKNRSLGEAQEDTQFANEDYMRQYGYKTGQAETDQRRKFADLDLSSTRFERDTEREKGAAIAGQVSTLRGEAIDEYLLGADAYYQNPNWGSMI